MRQSSMSRFRKLATIGAAGALGALMLVGCSSGGDAGGTTPSAAQGSAQIIGPVIIEQGQTAATAKVGDFLDFLVDDPLSTTITTSDPTIVDVTPGFKDGDATFNPSGRAITAGTATITITDGQGTTSTVTVTVS